MPFFFFLNESKAVKLSSQWPAALKQTASLLCVGKIYRDPSRALCKSNSWVPLTNAQSCRSKKGRREGLSFFFYFYFFSLNHHLLLEHRIANDEGEKGLRKSYFSPLPCVVQCIQSRGLSSFTEKEEWADLTWTAAPLREGESNFQSKC